MKQSQTEYQDKFWDYSKGFQVETDPYEELVQMTALPQDFSSVKKKSTKTKKSAIKKRQSEQSSKDECFVSSSGKKAELKTRVIIHKPGARPEEISDRNSSRGQNSEISSN